MHVRFLIAVVSGLILSATTTRATAALIVAGLEPPTYVGNTATLGVTFEFSSDPGDTVDAFQLSVVGSDPLLTANGTDFGRFSFLPNLTLLPDWDGIQTSFEADGFVFYSTLGSGLAPSATPYLLGVLSVDLSGLSSSTPLTVSLNGQDTLFPTGAAGMIGGTFDPIVVDASAATAQLQLENSPVPEPSSAVLLAVGSVLGLCYCRLRKR